MAPVVNPAGAQLLARPRLSPEQDGGVGRSPRLDLAARGQRGGAIRSL